MHSKNSEVIQKCILELHLNGKIDIEVYRYYSRLLSLAETAVHRGKNKIDLRDIGISLNKK